jgi:hypothetical protein
MLIQQFFVSEYFGSRSVESIQKCEGFHILLFYELEGGLLAFIVS